jgi:hypothetical protein
MAQGILPVKKISGELRLDQGTRVWATATP